MGFKRHIEYLLLYMFLCKVNGVSTVAGHVADKVAPHVKKHGAKLVPESMKKSQDGRASNLDGAKFVAASSVKGIYKPLGNKHAVIVTHTVIHKVIQTIF